MLARVQSYLLQGIDALACEVEIDHDINAYVGEENNGSKAMVVGLPDASVKESIERVRSALANSGHSFPTGRALVNLAPADVRKEGPMYDLPIAVGLLIASGVIGERGGSASAVKTRAVTGGALANPERERGAGGGGGTRKPANGSAVSGGERPVAHAPGSQDPNAASIDFDEFIRRDAVDPRQYIFAGELALDGRLRPIRGVIAAAALAKQRGYRGVIVPRDNAVEAAIVQGVESIGVSTLSEVVGILTGNVDVQPVPPVDVAGLLAQAEAAVDFADVRGQEAVKRAIIVAAAGSHNLIMLGPAGTGKTMMARALSGVLPPLTADEAIEITRIYSAAGMLAPGTGLITARPVRTPHHTASAPAIVGGGMVPRPGEISLAHRGVLFLDELPEFPRDVLETLRQPLEDHVVTIARSHSAVRFPANFMLVAAMNPTPKGDIPTDDFGKRAMDRYLAKLSGPLIDRIDIHVEAPAVPWKELSRGRDPGVQGTSSAHMREQVQRARERQIARQGATTPNSRLSGRQLDQLATLDENARTVLGQAMTELKLSARAYDKIRRVARTIADLDGSHSVAIAHVGEAVAYRLLDRRL